MLKLLIPIFCLGTLSVCGQYKNDNVLFTTIDPSSVCDYLQQAKNYLVLDVRTKGEHYDTSAFGANIGHLKGSKNIEVSELAGRLGEIKAYKDQPVFVYCSHSQRSRRASKLLADSGFTKVYNINGGMTALYYTDAVSQPCLSSLIETENPYRVISPANLCKKLSGTAPVFLLDVRTDSAFRHISTSERNNAMGSFTGEINIPLDQLERRIGEIPTGKEIIVTDLSGNDAAVAAKILVKNGFENVDVLIEGMSRWLTTDKEELACLQLYHPSVSYQQVSPQDAGRLLSKSKDILLIDMRSTTEFNNQHADYWRNIGHLSNAVNIPLAGLQTGAKTIEAYKNKPVLLYDFGNSNDVHKAALILQQNGFTNVNVLMGGIFNLRWTAANRVGQAGLSALVTDVPEINW